MNPQRPLVTATAVMLMCCVASAQQGYNYGSGGGHSGFGGVAGGGLGGLGGVGVVGGGRLPAGGVGGNSVVRIYPTARGEIPNYAFRGNVPVSNNVIRLPVTAMHFLPSTGGATGGFGGGRGTGGSNAGYQY